MNAKNEVIRSLQQEANKLQKIIRNAERRLEKAPEGCVIIRKHGRGYQYYRRTDPKDRNGVYIPVSQNRTAYDLAQKKYDRMILYSAKQQLKSIESFLRKYDPDALKEIYALLSDARKQMVIPAELPDDEYTERWQALEYEKKVIPESTPEHYTGKGERVRSKSEVIIADALARADIPYRYEYPLLLNGYTIHPDFTILRKRDRKEYFLEHLGMMDDTEYRNQALSRISMYQKNGIFLGDRLILTAETVRQPLNAAEVNRMIEHYFIEE